MGETFLININCSKVLAGNDETRYTMFIDSTKMSIVYELVEWIRWIFSLENCFYITHDNSVIHELEDIQVLSRLKNFELKPCGRPHCVHKKIYRTLLKNVNMFVSWNGVEVHKYFLHKLNQVDQKLIQENSKSPVIYASGNKSCQDLMDFKGTNTDNAKNSLEGNNLFLSENKLPQAWKDNAHHIKRTLTGKLEASYAVNGESPTKLKCSLDKKILNENFLINSEDKLNYLGDSNSTMIESLTGETSKSTLINNSPVNAEKNTFKTVPEQNKNCQKFSKKYVKPFSLGEILSNIRADFEKQSTETQNKKNSPSSMEEENLDENIASRKDLFITENNINEGKKRRRTRKRKKSKKENIEKEETTSPYLDTKIAACNLDTFKMGNIKPNHIRFDVEEEDNLMETESVGDEQNIQNENICEIITKQMDSTPPKLPKTSPKELTTVDNNQELSDLYQICPVMNNTEDKMQYSSSIGTQAAAEEKLIDLGNSDNTNQLSGSTENFESNSFKPDLNTLLSLKEKFKNAVVFERFY